MIYALDACAFYDYYGRDKLPLGNSKRNINFYEFRYFLDSAEYKVLPTSTFIELSVHFRDDFKTWVKLRTFLGDKNFIPANTSTTRYSDKEVDILSDAKDEITFKSIIKKILNHKIEDEAGYIFLVLMSLMRAYFIRSFQERFDTIGDDIPGFLIDEYIVNVHPTFLNYIIAELNKGYSINEEAKSAKDAFRDLLRMVDYDTFLFLENFSPEYGAKVPDREHNDTLKIKYHMEKRNGKGKVQDVLKNNPCLLGKEFHRKMIDFLVDRVKCSELQAAYLISIMQKWLDSSDKTDKNDIFDLFFLGVLDKKKQIVSQLELTPYEDDTIIALSFDGSVIKCLKNANSPSYNVIQRFYQDKKE